MGDSIDVIIQEMSEKGYEKTIKVDNTAAVNLLTESAGSWRTRHLRLRAAHLRWRLGRLDWLVESIPGEEQVADIGTKVLSSPKLEVLKTMMNMGIGSQRMEKTTQEKQEEEDGGWKGKKKESGYEKNEEVIERALKMIVIAMMIQGSNGQEEEEEEDERVILFWTVCFMVAVINVIGLWVTLRGLWRLCCRMSTGEVRRQPEEEPEVENEEEVAQGGVLQEGDQEEEQRREEEVPSSSMAVVQRDRVRQRTTKGRGKGHVVIEERRVIEEPEPLVVLNRWEPADQRRGGRGPAFITTYGTKWHQFTTCGPLAQRSQPLISSTWCPQCADVPRMGYVPVFSTGRGGVVHYYDSRCTLLSRDSRCYQKCAMCHMMDPNR